MNDSSARVQCDCSDGGRSGHALTRRDLHGERIKNERVVKSRLVRARMLLTEQNEIDITSNGAK